LVSEGYDRRSSDGRSERFTGDLHDPDEAAWLPAFAGLRWKVELKGRCFLGATSFSTISTKKDDEVRMMRAYMHSTPDAG